ncbi:MAG: nickel/cobalt transporter [Actinomycetota bacterium]
MSRSWWFAAAGIIAALTGIAAPASAHPQGTKPVALIRGVAPAELEILWVVALDDFSALLRARELITEGYDPDTLDPGRAASSLRAYFAERAAVTNDGGVCPQRVAGAGLAGPGVAVSLRFDCPAPLTRLEITLTLLQDISADYVTIAQAGTPAGPARGIFSAAVPTIRLDLTAVEPAVTPVATGTAVPAGRTGRILAALQGQPGATSLVAALGLAFVLGALHALTPGHGKTLTAAYLVGAGGSARQAVVLGGIVSATHAASVAVLGGIAVALDRLFLPNDWVPWTEVVAGALMVGLGAALFRGPRGHGHDHGDGTGTVIPWRRLALVGFVGGLIPSPEALGVLLVALSIGKAAGGMALVGAFSLGLALVVLGVALLAVRGGAIARRIGGGSWTRWLPRVAAAIVTVLGTVVAIRGAIRL